MPKMQLVKAMNNSNLARLNTDDLARQSFEQLQFLQVTAVVLGLGSNFQAEYYLPQVRKSLVKLGQIRLSTAFENPDITATQERPKPNYINQCVHLVLNESTTLIQLRQGLKKLEDQCGRQRETNESSSKQVTIDIDILSVKLENNQNSLSDKMHNWTIITERYPFADHEKIGVEELGIII